MGIEGASLGQAKVVLFRGYKITVVKSSRSPSGGSLSRFGRENKFGPPGRTLISDEKGNNASENVAERRATNASELGG